MKKKYIIVRYKGEGLLVNPEVAHKFSLKNGDNFKDEDHFWKVLGANAEHELQELRILIAAKNREANN